MDSIWGTTVVFDSSTLINFLVIDRLDLVLPIISDPVVTDVVRAEISNRFQCTLLETALTEGSCRESSLSSPEDLAEFRDFINGGLGRGESASIVTAHALHIPLALDDKVATRRARRAHPKLIIVTTKDIVLAAIDHALLSVAQADELKDVWKNNHRFTLPFDSFADLRP